MVTQVKQQIAEARTQLDLRRGELVTGREQAQSAEDWLKEQEQKIPAFTQARLRGKGLYAGMPGLPRRTAAIGIQKEITGKLGEVDVARTEMGKYEVELEDYEQKIKGVERQIADYEKEKAVIEAVNRLASRPDGSNYLWSLVAFGTPTERKYAKMAMAEISAWKQQAQEMQEQQLKVDLGVPLGDIEKFRQELTKLTRDPTPIGTDIITTPTGERVLVPKELKTPTLSPIIPITFLQTPVQKFGGFISSFARAPRQAKIDIPEMTLPPAFGGPTPFVPPTETPTTYITTTGSPIKTMTLGETPKFDPQALRDMPRLDIRLGGLTSGELIERGRMEGLLPSGGISTIATDKLSPVIETLGKVQIPFLQSSITFTQEGIGLKPQFPTFQQIRTIPLTQVGAVSRSAPSWLGQQIEKVTTTRLPAETVAVTLPQRGTLWVDPFTQKVPIKGGVPVMREETVSLPERDQKIPLIKYVPEALAYLKFPAVMLTGDVLTAAEKYRTIDEQIEKMSKELREKHLNTKLKDDERHLTTREWEIIVVPELKRKLEMGTLKEGALATVMLGGVGVFKGIQMATKPKIIDIKSPKVSQWGAEVQYLDAGKPAAQFFQVAYKSPATGVLTTPLRQFFRRPGTPIQLTKPQIYLGQPALGAPVRMGTQPYTFQIAKASQADTLPKFFGDLTKRQMQRVEEFALRRQPGKTKFFEIIPEGKPQKITTTEVILMKPAERELFLRRGLPKKWEEPMLLFTKDKFYRSGMFTREYFKPLQASKEFYVAQRIRPSIKLGEAEVFKVTLRTRPKPFLREGISKEVPIRVIKLPINVKSPTGILRDLTDVKWIKPEGQALQQFLRQPTKASSPIMSVPRTQLTPAIQKQTQRTILGTISPKAITLRPKEVQVQVPIQKQRMEIIPKTAVSLAPKTQQMRKVRLTQRPISETKVRLTTIPKTIGVTKVMQGIKPRLAQKIISRTATKTKTPTITRQILITPRRPTGSPPKKIRIPKPKIPSFIKKEMEISKRKPKDLFYVPEVRRRGRWIALGKFRDPKRAIKTAKVKVKRTLAASLRVRRGQEVIPIEAKTKIFRPAKREAGVLVQKRRERLSSPTEVREIIAARRTSWI